MLYYLTKSITTDESNEQLQAILSKILFVDDDFALYISKTPFALDVAS